MELRLLFLFAWTTLQLKLYLLKIIVCGALLGKWPRGDVSFAMGFYKNSVTSYDLIIFFVFTLCTKHRI